MNTEDFKCRRCGNWDSLCQCLSAKRMNEIWRKQIGKASDLLSKPPPAKKVDWDRELRKLLKDNS